MRANPAKRKATASEASSEGKPAKSLCHRWLNEFKYLEYVLATIRTTNFRRSTLDCHGDSREHIITTKKEWFLLLLFAASPVVPLRSNWPTPGYVNLSVLSYLSSLNSHSNVSV